MNRAIRALADGAPDAIALVESQLLGALMLCPYLRLDCGALKPQDFSSPHRGAAFEAILAVRHPEASLVALHLTDAGAPPPPRCTGWADAIGRLLDAAFVEDDAVPAAVDAIRTAARSRRLDVILGRADAA